MQYTTYLHEIDKEQMYSIKKRILKPYIEILTN